jgi:dTDP-4-dehydrorhamnose reductase
VTAPRVLVTGAGGMLGRSWCELLQRQGVSHLGLSRAELDLSNESAVRAAVVPGIEWVINCGAYTQVDKAEQEEDLATVINGSAVGWLAESAKLVGARLVHYSTDYVFAGSAEAPYPTDAQIQPINAYGRSKAEGERLFIASGVSGLLLRTSWVYAPWGKNFVRTIARLLAEKPELRVVSDQRGRPTSAEHLAQNSWRLCSELSLAEGERFVGHLTDGGECTWFDFAREIGSQLGLVTPIHPCSTADYPLPARRPAYSVLDLSECERVLGPLPDWRRNLAHVLQQHR